MSEAVNIGCIERSIYCILVYFPCFHKLSCLYQRHDSVHGACAEVSWKSFSPTRGGPPHHTSSSLDTPQILKSYRSHLWYLVYYLHKFYLYRQNIMALGVSRWFSSSSSEYHFNWNTVQLSVVFSYLPLLLDCSGFQLRVYSYQMLQNR